MSTQLINFSDRLKSLLSLSGYRSVDLINHSKIYQDEFKTKLTKQDISNYLTNKSTPLNNKLNLICKTLGVEPNYFTNNISYNNINNLTNEELMLVNCWRASSPKDKDMIAYVLKDYGFVYEKEAKNVV